jgi:ribosome maturation factor RimP
MIETERIRKIIEDRLRGSDTYLVSVEVEQDNKIVVEIDNDLSVSIGNCIDLTRYIETQLDRNIEDYDLEVGSTGISQPFKILRQYKKNIGKEVEIVLKEGKKYSGILKTVDETQLTLTVETQIKPEGAKRKITVKEDLIFEQSKIKQTKNIIRFK